MKSPRDDRRDRKLDDSAGAFPDRERMPQGEWGTRAMRSVVRAHVDEHIHLRPWLESIMEPSTWCIDRIAWSDGEVEIRGWALPPPSGYSPATFTIDGARFDDIDYPRSRSDIGELFWFRPGAALSGFVCRSEDVSSDQLESGPVRFDFCDARTLRPFREEHAFFGLPPSARKLPLPGSAQRQRVHGNVDEDSFLTQGASAFVKLEQALGRSVGKSYKDFPRILDWGCGCGRVARYFASLPHCSVEGIDIDEENVEWCSRNLPFASFQPCAIDPPTPLADGSIDLVIGISVMTHLLEADRFAWLEELARVCRDGAVALLTAHGAAAVCRASFGLEGLALWRQSGAVGIGVSAAARELSPDPSRYVDCFLSEEYIRDRWAQHFEVLDVIPGYIGNVQDLVVLKKRPT